MPKARKHGDCVCPCHLTGMTGALGPCAWCVDLHGRPTWTCPTCGRACFSEAELKAHALLHNDGTESAEDVDPWVQDELDRMD